jgi:hypothetical protein
MNVHLPPKILEAAAVSKELVEAARPSRKKFDPANATAKRVRAEAPEFIHWVVDQLLPRDVGLLNATGGQGKSTLTLWMAVLYAIRQPLFGCSAQVPGKVLIISGEDPEGRIGYRLNKVCEAAHLTPDELAMVDDNIFVEDFSSESIQLVESDGRGNLQLTDAVDELIAAYKGQPIRWIILDPLISFGPGESYVNDGFQKVIIACRKLVAEFNCFVQLVHHVSKEVATNKTTGQHAGRGGTALGDGSRFESQLMTYRGMAKGTPKEVPSDLFARGGSLLAFHIHKLSDAGLPAEPFWITREGFQFTWIPGNGQDTSAHLEAEIDMGSRQQNAILGFLREHEREHFSINMLRERGADIALWANERVPAGKSALPKLAKGPLVDLIKSMVDGGRIEETPLPAGSKLRVGARKTYLRAKPESFIRPSRSNGDIGE